MPVNNFNCEFDNQWGRLIFYDQRSRPLGYTDNLGQRMTLSYDDYGNVTQMDTFNADGSKALTNNRSYDERNRLTHVSAPHAPGVDSVVQYLLDPESNVIGVILAAL